MIRRAEALCVCGPSGTGKSHLVEALGHLAIDQGKTVAWHTLESLAVLLKRHRADGSVNKAIGRLIRADLDHHRRHRHAAGHTRRRRSAVSRRRRRLRETLDRPPPGRPTSVTAAGVGLRLDLPEVDWDDVAGVIEDAHAYVLDR